MWQPQPVVRICETKVSKEGYCNLYGMSMYLSVGIPELTEALTGYERSSIILRLSEFRFGRVINGEVCMKVKGASLNGPVMAP